ncbi:MAG: hypothetical protein RLZZ232_75 [Planctomycetota bacterium]
MKPANAEIHSISDGTHSIRENRAWVSLTVADVRKPIKAVLQHPRKPERMPVAGPTCCPAPDFPPSTKAARGIILQRPPTGGGVRPSISQSATLSPISAAAWSRFFAEASARPVPAVSCEGRTTVRTPTVRVPPRWFGVRRWTEFLTRLHRQAPQAVPGLCVWFRAGKQRLRPQSEQQTEDCFPQNRPESHSEGETTPCRIF